MDHLTTHIFTSYMIILYLIIHVILHVHSLILVTIRMLHTTFMFFFPSLTSDYNSSVLTLSCTLFINAIQHNLLN